jgi:hypothetical protein
VSFVNRRRPGGHGFGRVHLRLEGNGYIDLRLTVDFQKDE